MSNKQVRTGHGLSTVRALAVAAIILGPAAAQAQVSDDVVKIGVLSDMTEPSSTPTGQGSVTAARSASQ